MNKQPKTQGVWKQKSSENGEFLRPGSIHHMNDIKWT